ncbi:MAG: DUF3098 domain-containing protein [Prevotella sp.]|nr:DUF3098 domain-containing protein [Prevotella sp.]
MEEKNTIKVGRSDPQPPNLGGQNLAFGRMNFILLAVGMAIVIIGFILMSGGGSTEQAYDPEIFSARRIKVAPLVCLFGFVSIICAVAYKPADKGVSHETESQDTQLSNQ